MADQPTLNLDHQSPESTPIHNPELKAPESVNPLAEQFSRVVKQEKFIAEERKKIEEAKKAFENDRQEVEKYRKLKGRDPFEILEHFGIDYPTLLEADKNRGANALPPAVRNAMDEVQQTLLKLEEREKQLETEKLSRNEIRLMTEIDKVVSTHEYDLIEKLGEQNAVRTLMEELYEETGEIPDIKEACETVTKRLVAKFSAIKDSKWLKVQEPVEEPKEVDHIPKKADTLSNKMAQSTVGSDRPMTEAERMKAAIVAMNAVKTK